MAQALTVSRRGAVAFAATIAIIGGLVGGGAVFAATSSFSDVPDTHPFVDEIEWGSQNGIIQGYLDGTFRPGNDVSRGAAAAFISRYNDQINVYTNSWDPASGDYFGGAVQCPGNQRPLGGGGQTAQADLMLTQSYPIASGWFVSWESEDDAAVDPNPLTGYVICAPEGTPKG